MSSSEDSNSRTFYRLRYPSGAGPSIRIDGLAYAVTELSESGVRILLEPDSSVRVNDRLIGHVTFFDQETEVIEGEIARIERNGVDQVEAILHLSKGVSLKRMLSEQVRIRSEYLTLIAPADGRSNNPD